MVLTAKQVRSNNNFEGNESDDNTETDLSTNNEGNIVQDVSPHKTHLATYFRKNYDLDNSETKLVKDMVTICDNQGQIITFMGMCNTILKVQKVNNALRQQLLSMKKNTSEVVKNKRIAKINDFRAFLIEKVVNLFRYKFIMVSL